MRIRVHIHIHSRHLDALTHTYTYLNACTHTKLRTATMKENDIKLMAEGMHTFAWKDWIGAFFKCAVSK